MAPITGDAGSPASVTYPRFHHDSNLFVLYHRDGTVEFQSGSPGEYVRAEGVVTVEDVC